MSEYVELHAKSAFSFLRGASLPGPLAESAAKLELEALAVLDHMGLYGAPRFASASRDVGVRAIHGAELLLEDGSVLRASCTWFVMKARSTTMWRWLSRSSLVSAIPLR